LILSGEPVAFVLSIHMIFSILWWSTTLIVIFIIRPSNKTGNLSSILPKIRRLVIIVSSVSIFSGLMLYGLFSNLDVRSYIYSYPGFVILISGSLSLVVYFHVLNGGQHKFILVKNSTGMGIGMGMGMGRYIPFVMFGLLTITLILMVIVSTTYRLS
jgi:hypothetical protein